MRSVSVTFKIYEKIKQGRPEGEKGSSPVLYLNINDREEMSKNVRYKPGIGTRGGRVCHGHDTGVCWHMKTGPAIVVWQQTSWWVIRVANCSTNGRTGVGCQRVKKSINALTNVPLPDIRATVKGMNIPSMCTLFEDQVFTAQWLHSHKGQRNANHSTLSNICLTFLLIARDEMV